MQLNSRNLGQIIKQPATIISISLLLLIGITVFVFFNGKKPATKLGNNNPSQLQNSPVVFDNTPPDTSKGNVEASSEIDGIKVLFISKNELINLFNSWKIYNRIYDLGDRGKNTGGVNVIKLVLTDKPLKGLIFDYQNKINGSSTISAKGTELGIRVYIDKKDKQNALEDFSNGALFPLYLLSHPYDAGTSKQQLFDDFASFRKSNPKMTSLFSFQTNN